MRPFADLYLALDATTKTNVKVAALAASGLPEWLFDASYDAVGDFAETISLVLPSPRDSARRSPVHPFTCSPFYFELPGTSCTAIIIRCRRVAQLVRAPP